MNKWHMVDIKTRDLATEAYWQGMWAGGDDLRPAVDPATFTFRDNYLRPIHRTFAEILRNHPGCSILEIGCAQSAWLTYFNRQYNLDVYGLDYSETGCEQSRAILKRDGVCGEVVCCDMFDPPDRLLRRFDFVVSFGVVEHFDDTGKAIQAMARMVAPGGMLLTIIPNMVGLVGLAQKLLNRPVYDLHVPIDRRRLREEHERAGLQVVQCDYLGSANFGVANLHGIPTRSAAWRAKTSIQFLLRVLTRAIWACEAMRIPIRSSRVLSPNVFAQARVE